jgi:putative endonuclease
MAKIGFTYLLTNKNKTVLYCGVTSDLRKRVWEHKNKIHHGFTKKYNVEHLIYFEIHDDIQSAIRREKVIKKMLRKDKIGLIEQSNSDWKDLFSTL